MSAPLPSFPSALELPNRTLADAQEKGPSWNLKRNPPAPGAEGRGKPQVSFGGWGMVGRRGAWPQLGSRGSTPEPPGAAALFATFFRDRYLIFLLRWSPVTPK